MGLGGEERECHEEWGKRFGMRALECWDEEGRRGEDAEAEGRVFR